MLARAVHPGKVLKDELVELGTTPAALSRQIDVPAGHIRQIIAGKRAMTADTALRLGHWFGTAPLFWMQLQAQHDLAEAERTCGDAVNRLPRREGLTAPNKASDGTAGTEGGHEENCVSPANCQIIGTWRIFESDSWDKAYIDMVGPATMTIHADGQGEMAFGCVEASLDIDYRRAMVFFRWDGVDEGDQIDGTGSAELIEDGSLEIELSFSQGDEAVVKARRQ